MGIIRSMKDQRNPKSRARLKSAKQTIEKFGAAVSSIQLNSEFSKAIDLFNSCNGKIVTSGMGKAGIVMMKFSSSLCSMGLPSCYLHPGEASHGDLGLLDKNDILFVASTSGKTREVIELIDLARNIGVKTIIGITSHKDSHIRVKVDCLIDMGEIEEAGHLRLAPTTSIIVMLAITDTLALCCSEEKGFTKEDYSMRHHGGYLGQKSRGEID